MAKKREKTWIVSGSIRVGVTVAVEAENENEARAEAMALFDGGLTNFAGNGGTDQIVGVNDERISLEGAYGVLEIESAEEEG